MKYEQPYGVTDPNASYINGNPAAGIQGSIPPAAAFENPMREIVAMIAGGGLTPSDSDLQQLLRAVRSQFANYCVDQGTLANNYLASFNPPILSYYPGQPFRLLVKNTNTGVSSFDGGAGRFPVTRYGGAALSAGDMPANSIAELVWNQAQARFELMNYAGTGSVGSPPPVTVSGLINVQIFTASGTYAVTTGATKALVFATGAGGSGSTVCSGGGGGGAGATAIALVNLAGPPAITSVPITIGAGGASVVGGASIEVSGNTGGTTSFGTYASAQGGAGGQMVTYQQSQGGLGGATTTGLVHIVGGDGDSGTPASFNASNGTGGGSFWGGGGLGQSTIYQSEGPISGMPGRAFGAGGGGAFNGTSGAGANGVVLILEF